MHHVAEQLSLLPHRTLGPAQEAQVGSPNHRLQAPHGCQHAPGGCPATLPHGWQCQQPGQAGIPGACQGWRLGLFFL